MLTQNFHFDKDLREGVNIIIIHFHKRKSDRVGDKEQWTWAAAERNKLICPIHHILSFIKIRPSGAQHLFCYQNGKPVLHYGFLKVLNRAFKFIKPNMAYSSHSLRMGRAVYLRLSGWSNEQIMAWGRWASSQTARLYAFSNKKSFL